MKMKLVIFVVFIVIYTVTEIINTSLMAHNLQRSYLIHLSGLLTGFLIGPFFIIKNFYTEICLKTIKIVGVTMYIIATSVLVYFNF